MTLKLNGNGNGKKSLDVIVKLITIVGIISILGFWYHSTKALPLSVSEHETRINKNEIYIEQIKGQNEKLDRKVDNLEHTTNLILLELRELKGEIKAKK